MASPVEHLFSNFTWSAWRKAHALRRALVFLLVAFIAMRLGTFVPLPGVNSQAWSEAYSGFGGIFF